MITLNENMLHQITLAGTGMIAEAQAGHVNVTGYKLLEAPIVEVHDDGSITLRIAVADITKREVKRGKSTDPVYKEPAD